MYFKFLNDFLSSCRESVFFRNSMFCAKNILSRDPIFEKKLSFLLKIHFFGENLFLGYMNFIVLKWSFFIQFYFLAQLFFCGKGASWGPTPYPAYIPGALGPRQCFFFPWTSTWAPGAPGGSSGKRPRHWGPWGPTPFRDSIKKKWSFLVKMHFK